MNDYFVLHIENLKPQYEPWLSEQAFACGALGISEVLPFDQPEGEEDVFTRIPETRAVDVYFEQAPPPKLLHELRATLPEARLQISGQPNRDWLAEWKKGFKPFLLTEGHWVVPSWCEPPAQAKHKIWIDPGMAFGTGTHETTQLVAENLAQICAQNKLTSALDVGTGTGILIMLAQQLGLNKLRATEIEADSRRVAKENFAANGMKHIVLDARQLEELDERYDVVMANIIDGVLVRVQEALKARVAPGGWLLVSGIIGEREKDFVEGFKLPPGHTWERRVQKGDWLLFAARL